MANQIDANPVKMNAAESHEDRATGMNEPIDGFFKFEFDKALLHHKRFPCHFIDCTLAFRNGIEIRRVMARRNECLPNGWVLSKNEFMSFAADEAH